MTKKAEVFAAVTAILVILFYYMIDAAGEEKNKLVFQGETFVTKQLKEAGADE